MTRPTDTEVTPEMLAAGVGALNTLTPQTGTMALEWQRIIATVVYRAMDAHRPSEKQGRGE